MTCPLNVACMLHDVLRLVHWVDKTTVIAQNAGMST